MTLQQRADTVDALGQGVETWTDVATVWASAQPLRGREFFAAGAMRSEASVRFRIRYRAGVTGAMRVLWRSAAHALVAEPIDVDGGRHTIEMYCASSTRDVDESAVAYTPSLNFSDARNSQYAAGSMTTGLGVN
jgi:SPP1 family predicted phage head-tail adaptor